MLINSSSIREKGNTAVRKLIAIEVRVAPSLSVRIQNFTWFHVLKMQLHHVCICLLG